MDGSCEFERITNEKICVEGDATLGIVPDHNQSVLSNLSQTLQAQRRPSVEGSTQIFARAIVEAQMYWSGLQILRIKLCGSR